jgi:hypothetical protein
MVTTSNRQLKEILSVIICLVLLRPHFDFGPPLLGVYFADGIILLLILATLTRYKIKATRSQIQSLFICYIYIFLLIFPIILHFFMGNVSFDLIFKYFILIYYILFFWFLTIMASRLENPYEFYSKLINVSFIIIFFVALIQFLNPPILGDYIKAIYGSEKLRNIYSGYPRVYSTFYNANWFGVYLVFYLGWINSNFILKKISLKKYLKKMVLVSLLMFSIGSRTAILGGSIVMFVQWFDFRFFRRAIKFLPIIIILVPSIFWGLSNITFLHKTLNRFTSTWNQMLQVGFDMSVLDPGRWYTWSVFFERFKNNPLVGSGGSGELIPHNSYLYFLDTFGLMGVSITILCVVAYLFIRTKEDCKLLETKISRKWLYSFILSFGVMSILADFIFTTQIMLLMVISLSINHTLKKRENELLGVDQ